MSHRSIVGAYDIKIGMEVDDVISTIGCSPGVYGPEIVDLFVPCCIPWWPSNNKIKYSMTWVARGRYVIDIEYIIYNEKRIVSGVKLYEFDKSKWKWIVVESQLDQK